MIDTASDRLSRAVAPRIAVDLLGGDDAPAVVVDGALRELSTDPHLHLVAVGPQSVADGLMTVLPAASAARVTVHVATRGVAMADPPTRGADHATSIRAAAQLVATGAADAAVSAGASGATVAAAVLALGRLSGVRRPALAVVLPGRDGPLVLLDVGAGLQPGAADLLCHATLGAAYARLGCGIAEPRIGLLTVGAEPGKGDRLRRAADAALRVHHFDDGVHYVGPVEGNDVVLSERADVVVTDGFTGNVLLKGLEAAFAAAGPQMFGSIPRGAVLLGVGGPVVVCHGAASPADIASGLALAASLVRADLLDGLTASVAPLVEVSV